MDRSSDRAWHEVGVGPGQGQGKSNRHVRRLEFPAGARWYGNEEDY